MTNMTETHSEGGRSAADVVAEAVAAYTSISQPKHDPTKCPACGFYPPAASIRSSVGAESVVKQSTEPVTTGSNSYTSDGYTSDGYTSSGYACVQCGGWIFSGWPHTCPSNTAIKLDGSWMILLELQKISRLLESLLAENSVEKETSQWQQNRNSAELARKSFNS